MRHARSKVFYLIVGFISGWCIIIIINIKDDCRNKIAQLAALDEKIENKDSLKFRLLKRTEATLSSKVKAARHNSNVSPAFSDGAVSYEWLSCADVKDILEKVKNKKESQYRKENINGNKAIYFSTIQNQTGYSVRVVIKHATLMNLTFEPGVYRYRSALREIENLRKVNELEWKGIPYLYGYCVYPHEIIYIVSEIIGKPLCGGDGIDLDCFSMEGFAAFIEQTQNPIVSTLTWLSKVTCFFKQFEEHQVFMEDFSGINFYYSPQTLDIFAVDLDSLLFYGDVRINSRSTCAESSDCSNPTGNLWKQNALNKRIYFLCQDSSGYCKNHTCRGYDALLHTCGVAQWLLYPLQQLLPRRLRVEYFRIIRCMLEPSPEKRCTMKESCVKANTLLEKHKSKEHR